MAMEMPLAAQQVDVTLESDALPSPGEHSAAAVEVAAKQEKSRIEELLEQQTHLMMRHLQLTEDHSNSNSMQFMFHTANDMLRKVDPSVRGIFTDWHKELRVKTNIYVSQKRLWNRYQQAVASDTLIRPFAEEAKKTWRWPESYSTNARPVAVGEEAKPGPYDVATAFADIRQRHAREAQEFILLHHKACLEQISAELCLAHQCEALLQQVKGWIVLNGSFFRDQAQAEQLLTQQARCFAELTCREEMAKAERRIKDAGLPFALLVALRVLCILMAVGSPTLMSLERLLSVVAVLFSLFCGLGLFAEDALSQSVQALLGPLPKYLAGKMNMAGKMDMQLSTAVSAGSGPREGLAEELD